MGPKHGGRGPQYTQVGSGQIREGKEIKEKRGRAENGSTVVECFNLSWKERRWEGEEKVREEEGRGGGEGRNRNQFIHVRDVTV